MNGLLTGKRIVVTGAARGLGYHFAEACAAQGATVVMCDILQESWRKALIACGRRAIRSNLTPSILPVKHRSSRSSAPSARRGLSMA